MWACIPSYPAAVSPFHTCWVSGGWDLGKVFTSAFFTIKTTQKCIDMHYRWLVKVQIGCHLNFFNAQWNPPMFLCAFVNAFLVSKNAFGRLELPLFLVLICTREIQLNVNVNQPESWNAKPKSIFTIFWTKQEEILYWSI